LPRRERIWRDPAGIFFAPVLISPAPAVIEGDRGVIFRAPAGITPAPDLIVRAPPLLSAVRRRAPLEYTGALLARRGVPTMRPDSRAPEGEMTIFERKELPLSAAPLYYMAQADLVTRHTARLGPRIAAKPEDASAYVGLFRAEAAAFQGVVIAHIDQIVRSEETAEARREAIKDAATWIGFIRRGGSAAARRLKGEPKRLKALKSALHIGSPLSRASAGEILLETRYLDAVLPAWKTTLSPPIHEAELAQGAVLATAIELAVFGRVSAAAEKAQASFAKNAAWEALEEKSKHLLALARLELSRDPAHPDYPIRLEFEGLDEKFAPAPKSEPREAAPAK
jgi:hypothetical protein